MILDWLYRLILLGKSYRKKYIQEWCKHAGCSTMLFMMQRIIHMGDNKHTGIPKMMRPGMRCCHGLMSLPSLVSLKSLTSLMPTCEASDFCWWYVLLRLPIWGQATWTISWVSLGLCAVCPWPLFFQLLHITFSSRSCDNENVCYAAVMQQLCIKLPRISTSIWTYLKHFEAFCEHMWDQVLLFMVVIQGSGEATAPMCVVSRWKIGSTTGDPPLMISSSALINTSVQRTSAMCIHLSINIIYIYIHHVFFILSV